MLTIYIHSITFKQGYLSCVKTSSITDLTKTQDGYEQKWKLAQAKELHDFFSQQGWFVSSSCVVLTMLL